MKSLRFAKAAVVASVADVGQHPSPDKLHVDFVKAFDLVDQSVLLSKFIEYDFPPHVTAWSLSFKKMDPICY